MPTLAAEAQDHDERVLVLAPTAKDARLAATILGEAGVRATLCGGIEDVCRGIEAGAGAALISEEGLSSRGLSLLLETLSRQPAWSDLPLLVLTGEGADSEVALRTLETLGNVTLLERPIRVPALVSAVRAALRGRRRQYQIRGHLTESRETADALREADRRKDEFLAILAHELRNPLAPLRNALEAMRRSPSNHDAVTWARTIMERQVGQMVRLIDDLLDLSRVSRGKIQLKREPVELFAIVTDALEVCRPAIEGAGHALEVSLPDQPVRLDGDHTRLVQVLCNLLSNAAKYTPAGGRIRLDAALEGGDIVVSVTDTGVGIPQEMLSRVFDMFTQVDHSVERSQGGLGIGLTLVKRLVEMHGGAVEARSGGNGQGATFVVRLPRLVRVSPLPQPATRQRPERGPAPRRILVADDNRDAADSLANLLRLGGHDVRTAYDGEQAVAAAAEFRPDIALLDIGMPRVNGYDAAERIRAQPHGAGVLLVALTGWGQPEDKRRSAGAGFDHHFVKPIDPAVLERLMSERPDAKKWARLQGEKGGPGGERLERGAAREPHQVEEARGGEAVNDQV